MDNSLRYNPNKLLSYNRILNMVIGARGIGKSYAMKKYVINRWLKHKEKFVFIRRFKTELKKIKNYFNDVAKEFPSHKFEVKGWEFYIDGELVGWAIPLTNWQNEKSNAYPDVSTMIFDEFIREKDKSGYIPNDVEALLNLMDTIFRDRENVRCVCLSNSVTVANPYFLYFNLLPNTSKRYNAYESIVVEIPDSVDFSDERRKTRFGVLIDHTNYGDMSLDNEFTNDSETFIGKKTPQSVFKFALTYKGADFGVWLDVENTVMYVNMQVDPKSKNKFAINIDDVNDKSQFGKSQNNAFIHAYCQSFKKGRLRFENQVVRTMGYEILKKLKVQ